MRADQMKFKKTVVSILVGALLAPVATVSFAQVSTSAETVPLYPAAPAATTSPVAPSVSSDAIGSTGSPDVRYAPITASDRTTIVDTAQPLYPLSTPSTPVPGQRSAVFPGTIGGVDYSANLAAKHVVVEVARNAIPADGQTPVPVTIRVLDAEGKPLKTEVWATIEHSGGRIQLPGARTDEMGPRNRDADKTTTGVQLRVTDGVATFALLAPIAPQDVQLRITVGNEEVSGVVSFVPEMREMVASGLIEGIVNFGGKSNSVLIRPQHEDTFDREIRAWGKTFNDGKANLAARSAFFLRGTIKGEYLLTAAYDSDKVTRARLLRDIQTEEFYPVYGDSALRGNDAVSDSRLYVRVDKNKDYVLYGNFATGDGFSQRLGGGNVAPLALRSLGNYNRSATGVRLHKETEKFVGNVFAFRDSLRQVVEEFSSQGSGPYGLRNNAVLEGSEKIEMIVRSRDQPSRIISTTTLTRLVDYTFEPFSGRILLNTFLPSADSNLNPVSLRVTYEVDQGGEAFWVVGADGQLHLTETFEVGGSVVRDTNPLAEQGITSANVGWRITPETMLVAEIARTTTEVNTNATNTSVLPGMAGRIGNVSGNAWRVEMAHEGERTSARAFVGRSDPTFNNLSAPLTGGRGAADVYASYKLTERTKLYVQGQRAEDTNPGASDSSSISVGASFKVTEKLTADIGVRSLRESAGTTTGIYSTPFSSTAGLTSSIATGSGGSAVGFGNQSIDPVSGLVVINNGTSLASSMSNNTTGLSSETLRGGLGYKVNDRFTVGGEVEHDISGDPRRRYAIGGDYAIAERTRLYGRYEHQTGLSGVNSIATNDNQGNAFVFGVNSSYIKETQLFSEYRLRDAISGRDLQQASGVRNAWDLQPGLRLNTALERVQVMSGNAADAYGASVGIDYTANPLWRGSTRVEYRRSGDIASTPANEAFNTTLLQAMVARKLDRDWTLLARDYMLATDYDARGGVFQNRAQIGVAYRDTDTNLINALAKYELKTERDASDASVGTLATRAHIVSAHADYHPSRPWWMTGRIAGKWQRDRLENNVRDNFNAQLISGRVVYDVTEKWDVGVMSAQQFGQLGARQFAYGIETGYAIQQNLWLSVGYNKAGFRGDPDLVGYEYTRSGFYVRLRFKFDEDIFAMDRLKDTK